MGQMRKFGESNSNPLKGILLYDTDNRCRAGKMTNADSNLQAVFPLGPHICPWLRVFYIGGGCR